jgi:hypothetical protein
LDAGSVPPLGRQDRTNTEGLVTAVLASRPHPEQGFRTCLGILRLYRGVDPAHAEAVSAAPSKSARSLARASPPPRPKRDKSAPKDGGQTTLFDHANLRGPGYYH